MCEMAGCALLFLPVCVVHRMPTHLTHTAIRCTLPLLLSKPTPDCIGWVTLQGLSPTQATLSIAVHAVSTHHPQMAGAGVERGCVLTGTGTRNRGQLECLL